MISKTIWLKMGFTSFFWALMFYLGQYSVAYLSPESLSAWRFILGAVVVIPLVEMRQGIDIVGIAKHFMPLLLMAVLGIGGFNLALFHGMKDTSAINGSLIMALCPVIITAFSVLLGEKFSYQQAIGLVLGVLGVVIVISQGSLSVLTQLSFQKGDIWVLLAAVCWALYSTIPKRFIHNLPPLQITVATVSMASIILSLFAQSTQGDMLHSVPWSVAASIAAMGLFGSGIAYLWWNDAVRSVGAGTVSIFMNLVPIYTALIGFMIGQPLTMVHVIGTVFVLVGVSLTTASPKTAPSLKILLSNEVK